MMNTPEIDYLEAAAARQAVAVQPLMEIDPESWLFAQRARYAQTGWCDPYAEQMLRRAGMLPTPTI